ncbi:hypothetical protein GOP47_0009724 [Adiantum capillus-veneris]|uniref:Uncharacterized protein n=1 Tax=Adiantum capillus-veneris TaxID=13818 RepID=A0A9D4UY06_ADICA|nr:hypothetical protein GOP47_0009724 [Adiantum capillus-veneris]
MYARFSCSSMKTMVSHPTIKVTFTKLSIREKGGAIGKMMLDNMPRKCTADGLSSHVQVHVDFALMITWVLLPE